MRPIQVSAAAGAMLLLAACTSTGQNQNQDNRPRKETTTIPLRHVPVGVAELSADPSAPGVKVHLVVTGLAPGSKHPTHIHAGSCGSRGTILGTIGSVTASGTGNADVTTTLGGLTAIPRGAYIDMHSGPGVTDPEEARSLVCGQILGGTTAAHASLDPLAGVAGSDVAGLARLDLDRDAKTLTVTVQVSGLVAGSSHPNHIHLGSCEHQGKVAYGLTTLTADDLGNATATTTLKNVTDIAYNNWYVNVHFGPALEPQAQFSPVACGNVVAGSEPSTLESSPEPSPSPLTSASPTQSPRTGVTSPTPLRSPTPTVSPSGTP